MKPLLGQLQNQANLDDLLGSSKSVGGNFGRPGSAKGNTAGNKAGDSSFTDMLLSTIQKSNHNKQPMKVSAPESKPTEVAARQPRPAVKQAGSENAEHNARKSNAFSTSDTRSGSRSDIQERSSDATTSKPKATSTNEAATTAASSNGQATTSKASTTKNAAETESLRPESVASVSAPKTPAAGDASAESKDPAATNTAVMNPVMMGTGINALTDATNQDAAALMAMAAQTGAADAKNILAPLKNLMSGKGSPEALINRNVVLAFVTGHLEKLDPESLPSIVADSMLIKQAMSSGDVAQFMQTPMSIGELANLLELDQSLLNKASMAGLDPTKLVTPKDFINALGLDAGRVTSELTMLQQKLPTEGVAPYVQRAKALIAKAGNAASDGAKNINQAAGMPNGTKIGTDNSEIKTGTKVSTEIVGQPRSPVLPGEITTPLEAQTSANVVNPQSVNLAGLAQSAQAQGARQLTNNQALGQQTISGKTALASGSKPQASVDPADILAAGTFGSGIQFGASVSQTTDTSKQPALNLQDLGTIEQGKDRLELGTNESFSVDLLGETTSIDPYRELGQAMDITNATKIEFGGDGMNQRSLEELLLARGLNTSIQQNLSSASQIGSMESIKGEKLSEAEDAPIEMPLDLQASFSPETLTTTVTPMKEMAFANSGFGERESSDENASNFLKEQASDMSAGMSKGTAEIRESGEVFTSKLSDAPKAASKESIANKILGHAQMMFKNGGGSMRVDLEAPGIGKVDVAINLINNQLDVRIITASEQARDMISKEVVGLRDGLTQQGISLRGLEVGKAGESSPRNFAGQGQQQFGQGAQDQRATYNDMRDYAQSFKNSFAPRIERGNATMAPSMSRWTNSSIPSTGNGRLEVRV